MPENFAVLTKPQLFSVNIVMAVVSLACCLFLLLVAVATPNSSQSVHTTYLIRPNTSTPCPPSTSDRCLTLQEFAEEEEPEGSTTTDITLELMSGVHNLSTAIEIYNLESITALPLPGSNVLVMCTTPASLYFSNISHLQISQLSIDSCGMGLHLSAVNVIATSQAQFSHITIVNSNGSAISVYNSSLVLDSTVIDHCGFFDFSYKDVTNGGAVNAYNSKLLIVGMSVFSKNLALTGGAIFFWQGSLEIMGNTIFTHNGAGKGGAVCIFDAQTVMIGQKVQFNKNRAILYGGALLANTVAMLQYSGVYFNNTARFGGAMALYNTYAVTDSPTTTLGNHADVSGGGIILGQLSTLSIQSNGFMLENNTAVLSGGGMHVHDSDIHINATAKLVHNSAIEGGGCYLSGQSRFYFATEANVYFGNNLASQQGGAIFAEVGQECESYIPSGSNCLFAVQRVNTYLQLWNNTAETAGDVLYGGNINNCTASDSREVYNIQDISNITKHANSLSEIASDPFFVCFCIDGELQCSVSAIEVNIYPGQQFNISVVTVGQANGVVPSSVQAQLGPHSQATMGAFQNSQNTKTVCTNLTFTLYSKNEAETITLTAGKCSVVTLSLKTHINVTLLQCPEGFELSDSPVQCICNNRLQKYTNECTIHNQKIHRTSNFWSGYDNATRGLVLHPHCPFDYCTPPPNKFTMEHSDLQCSYNRTSLLCGQCQPEFSLALGTSRCLRCSNYYLALLPAFAVAGLALVVFLFVCRLTLAMGTINGLIFYANLVHSNRTLFFPMGNTNILTVFIAWLNLDLGLETCFYNGMDTYARTWLQFTFPLFVWVLCGCMVLISSKSYRMSRVLGKNPVAVLATLFLLSYTKLLHTAFAALSFTTLSYPQHNKLVWLYDANIQYLHGKHIPLFIVGLATLLLCLPYALLLLTSQWLRAWSNCRFFHWVNSHRVKFLLDVHNAPFKTKHCYWTGLLLLTRLVLYFVDAVNVLGNGNVNLLATCIVVAALSVWMVVFEQPYKSRLLGAIEALFLLNVLILSVSTLHIRSALGSQAALVYTSSAISLTVFVAILLFHGYLQIKHTNMWKTLTVKIKIKWIISTEEADDDDEQIVVAQVQCTEVVLPRHTGDAERMLASPVYNSGRDFQQNLNSESQPLQQHERAPAPPELSGSMGSCSSWQSWDNLSMPYTVAELREPLLSSDDNS